MKVYRIFAPQIDANNYDHYEGTLSAAHKWAKTNIGKPLWPDVVVEERELETDKFAIIEALNGSPRFVGTKSAKVWNLTVRGGLEEAKE